MEILKIPSTISKVTTMADAGMRIQVDTQELNNKEAGDIMMLKGKLGYFLFAEQPPSEEDVKNLPQIELEEGEKHPSQRLRAVLFVYWEQNKIKEPFDIFYRRKIEQFINRIKEELA